MTPKGLEAHGAQVPKDLATPVRVATFREEAGPAGATPEGSGRPFDSIGTPDLASPMSWSDLLALSNGTLQAWTSAMLEGRSVETPPLFHLPSLSPFGTH